MIDDDTINAFATMGGFVYVNKGLMAAADNEAELASVIAHEIAHISARHAIQQMRQMAIASGVASATGSIDLGRFRLGWNWLCGTPTAAKLSMRRIGWDCKLWGDRATLNLGWLIL